MVHTEALQSSLGPGKLRQTEVAAAGLDARDSEESDPESPAHRSDLEDPVTSQQTEATEVTQAPNLVAESVHAPSML